MTYNKKYFPHLSKISLLYHPVFFAKEFCQLQVLFILLSIVNLKSSSKPSVNATIEIKQKHTMRKKEIVKMLPMILILRDRIFLIIISTN